MEIFFLIFVRNEFTISDTLAFPELLKNIQNSDDYEDVAYDVESLFIYMLTILT